MYQGMTNEQTWQIASYIENKEDIYMTFQIAANTAINTNKYYDKAVSDLADVIKDYFFECKPALSERDDIYSSLLTWALEAVDWRQIASEIIDTLENDKGIYLKKDA